jgi:hypothetical protein
MGDNFGLNIQQGQGVGAGMSAIGTILNVVSNMSAGSAARRQGEAVKAESDFEAAQLNQAGVAAVASSQRRMIEERRRAAIVASRAQAVAAASGAGASDPTVMNVIADIEGEGAYRAAVALYEGEERQRQLNLGADAKRYDGEQAARGGRDRQSAYMLAGLGAGATGYATLYSKYGRGGPKAGKGSGAAAWGDVDSELARGPVSGREFL